jgi:hypothetical protein
MAKATQAVPETEVLPPEQQIIVALHSVMTEVSYVQKKGENDFHGYKYATEADMLERLRPALVKNGLIMIPSVQQVSAPDANGNTTVTVHYTLAHTSGAVWPHPIIAAGCGNDRSSKGGIGDKGLYKALTGANKYMLFKLFQIETGNDPENPDDERKRDEEDRVARQFYLEGGKIAVSKAETTTDLKAWWASEEQNRASAGVIKGSNEYSELYNVFLARGKELANKEK